MVKGSGTGGAYNVPILYPNLLPEEFSSQLLDVVGHLNHVTNAVFDRIMGQVAENRNRINALNDRIAVRKSQIGTLKGTSKATTVMSSAKFPDVPIIYHTPLFNEFNPNLENLHYHAPEFISPIKNTAERTFNLRKDIFMKSVKPAKRDIPVEDEAEEGLGPLPEFHSISDMLLFNTQDNPYKTYHSLDNLLGVKPKGDQQQRDKRKKDLGAAPETILTGEELDYFGGDTVAFKPKLTNVPELQLPDNLNLSNVASDVMWKAGEGDKDYIQPIAPSTASNLPSVDVLAGTDTADIAVPADLPTIESQPSGPPLPSMAGDVAPPPPPMPSSGPPPPPSSGAPPPPPPPPPNFGAPPPPPPPPGGDGSAPPPPPPPPPAMSSLPSTSLDNEEAASAPTFGGDGGDDGEGRDALLAAIRNANKGGLKSAKDRRLKEQKKDTAAPKVISNPTDLFGDLMASLQNRRKAFGGKKQEQEEESKDDDDGEWD